MESYKVKFAFNNSVYFEYSNSILILKMYAKNCGLQPQDTDTHILSSLYVVTRV
jgi:hypothetical protein